MTANDPAVEAARQAVRQFSSTGFYPRSLALVAAREALKPIRELHRPMDLKQSVFNGSGTFIGQRIAGTVCRHCYGGPQRESQHCNICEDDCCDGVFGPFVSAAWPCATARLVYRPEELPS